ncbi:SIS domain-containing protein [Friedmanniella luteola]|uniref:SIS domain-containing protein n=1 Tax=Friedmanniella luteola TaxID=546871 RepID=A0A1H1M2N7_9ACTN|nr:SIS domain-containing protein [Friedmanniella luteola]SDR80289.1 SIS domain-containing protein [Friedmanniella luteola]
MSEVARPRASTQLKHRLLEAHRAELAAGLAWASSDPSLEAAAALVTGSRRRFVIGAATSFTYASLLAAKLSAALAKVTLVDGTIVRPLDLLSDVRDSDVMIAVSFSPYRRYTVEAAVPFVRAGGALVVITDAPDAPLVAHATEAVVIDAPGDRSDSARLHPESPLAPPVVVAMVIDVLTALSSASAKGAQRRIADRERLAQELHLYL